jgi:hypothetical protein
MQARDAFAKIHPLLPYTPEPNLFLDALAVLGGPAQEFPPIKFGNGAAEFTQLAKTLEHYFMLELNTHYSSLHQLAFPDLPVDPINLSLTSFDLNQTEVPEDFYMGENFMEQDKTEIEARVAVDAQNNRHPVRGISFLVKFSDLAVETDLSRLAHDLLVKGRDAQDHLGMANVSERFFQDKPSRKGISFANYQEYLNKLSAEDFIKLYAPKKHKEDSQESFKIPKEGLPFKKRNKISQAISMPFPVGGPFSGQASGIRSNDAQLVGHVVCACLMVGDIRQILHSLYPKLSRADYSTPPDGNCLYHAIIQAQNNQQFPVS